jgi:hypothetical protein
MVWENVALGIFHPYIPDSDVSLSPALRVVSSWSLRNILAFLLCRNIQLDETEGLVWHSAYTCFHARRDYVTVIHRDFSFPHSLKGVCSWHRLYYRTLTSV